MAQLIFEHNSNETMGEVDSLTETEQYEKGFVSAGMSEQVKTFNKLKTKTTTEEDVRTDTTRPSHQNRKRPTNTTTQT